MTKLEAINAIKAEAACKVPRSPQFMADFAEQVINRIDGLPIVYGGKSLDNKTNKPVQMDLL